MSGEGAMPFELDDAPDAGPDAHVAAIGPGITTKAALMSALSSALALPSYFGGNWDALSECLRDLGWIAARTIVIRHAELPAIPEDELRTYLEVLAEAVAAWPEGDDHVLRVVFPTGARDAIERLRVEG